MAARWQDAGMSHPSRQVADNRELKVILVALVAVLVLASIVNSAVRPPTPPADTLKRAAQAYKPERDYMRHHDLAVQRIDQLALETNGDFSKLSAEDQRWLDGMTAGHGAPMLQGRAHALRKQAAAKK